MGTVFIDVSIAIVIDLIVTDLLNFGLNFLGTWAPFSISCTVLLTPLTDPYTNVCFFSCVTQLLLSRCTCTGTQFIDLTIAVVVQSITAFTRRQLLACTDPPVKVTFTILYTHSTHTFELRLYVT